ncbi:MAG: tRNA (adenosine(37)-N6)-threonylcarbamoyltransferase complex dimerization subunit type 1 TsaB [Planctomycetota bacterium]
MPNLGPEPAPSRDVARRLLAIETADRFGSVAAAELAGVECDGADSDGVDRATVLRSVVLPRDRRSARTLAPALGEMLGVLGWAPATLTHVAVSTGPGSFTGLRIGVTTAKTLAYAVGAAVVPISTLSALAAAVDPAKHEGGRIIAVLDAYRSELFTGVFEGVITPAAETLRVRRSDLASFTRRGDLVVSPIADTLDAGEATVRVAEPSAEAVARLAANVLAGGAGGGSPFTLSIDYGRPSAAEEKLESGKATS